MTVLDDIRTEMNAESTKANPGWMVNRIVLPLLDDLEQQILDSVPTSDPAEAGLFWNDSGTLTVSAGA